jgi:hypothetical protein
MVNAHKIDYENAFNYKILRNRYQSGGGISGRVIAVKSRGS